MSARADQRQLLSERLQERVDGMVVYLNMKLERDADLRNDDIVALVTNIHLLLETTHLLGNVDAYEQEEQWRWRATRDA